MDFTEQGMRVSVIEENQERSLSMEAQKIMMREESI